MEQNDIQTVNEDIELDETGELLSGVTVTDPRNIQFEIPCEENQHYESLSEDEKARWRKMFNNLDKIDNKKDDSVCISYVLLLTYLHVGKRLLPGLWLMFWTNWRTGTICFSSEDKPRGKSTGWI